MSSINTREMIITFLNNHPSASSHKLALELGLSGADIRYHLNNLLQDNLIEIVSPPAENTRSRGRPARYFSLVKEQQPNNYQQLANALMKLVQKPDSYPNDVIERVLANALCENYTVIKSKPRRLANAVNFLNAHHYLASWEARIHGPRIQFHNCPYAAIWSEYPFLCKMDELLVKNLTGLKMEQIETIQSHQGPHPACIFQAGSIV